jgi:hypothetical protein
LGGEHVGGDLLERGDLCWIELVEKADVADPDGFN